MRIIEQEISRAVIDAAIRAAAFPAHDPARWALPLLDEAQQHVAGWMLVQLDEEESGALWLPEHAGEPCHGDGMRLGSAAGGGTVADIASWLARHHERYAAASPSCWSRIAHAMATPGSFVVATGFSVGDRIKPEAPTFVVVDGLHRTLGWWLDGRRTFSAVVPSLVRPASRPADQNHDPGRRLRRP